MLGITRSFCERECWMIYILLYRHTFLNGWENGTVLRHSKQALDLTTGFSVMNEKKVFFPGTIYTVGAACQRDPF